ncbi:MAG: TldD/PmbA family protein [Myxococcota bacterium]
MSANQKTTAALLDIATRVVDEAKKRGAQVAEAVAREGQDLSAKVRLGEPELVEEAANRSFGLRVIVDDRSATTYTSDATPAGLRALVDDAIELARLSEADPLSRPPDPSELAKDLPPMDLFDESVLRIDGKTAIDLAIAAEKAARGFDPRISNSEGASFGRTIGHYALVTSGGFSGAYSGTFVMLSAEPVAEEAGGKKQVGSYWDSKRYWSELESAEAIGQEAARRTVAKLGTKKPSTGEMPVVFHPDAASSLLGLFLGCVSGGAIYRRSSYLCGREGSSVGASELTITDDPLIPRGPGSRPFDGEGLRSRRNVIVDRGALKSYLLDTYSARKLGKTSTGNASRGTGGPPGVAATNFVLSAGSASREEIIRGVDRGIFVTSMMGFGFNAVTGDFSRGAEGFFIEKGQLAGPFSEATVSLNFDELLKRIDAIGSDLVLRGKVAAPTLRVSRMTVAGGQ